ncbi:hypothetical protein FO519_007905 [Halicephalobus sp. NKZ332]|nr:hypothetical protein FO519_007905 [Halicephalobus sp. NKZ332]
MLSDAQPAEPQPLVDDGVQISKKLMAMIGAFYWFIMTVIVVPTACTFTFASFWPLIFVNLNVFNKLVHGLCVFVNDHWVGAGQYSGIAISEYGDDISKLSKKRVLFLANHLGLIDHFCLMTSFHNKKHVIGNYLWVIYNIWKSTPLGVMWTAHGNFFINGGADKRKMVLEDFKNHLKNYYWKHDFGWIVMYPEGSRLYLIKNSEKRFAEKNGLEPFKHCAHPRTGAAHTVLDVCGPTDESYTTARSGLGGPVEYIIDCTLGYPKGKVGGLGEVMVGEWPEGNSNVAIHYKIHKVLPEWSDESVLRDWLYKQYEEKDKMLDRYYKTGSFAGASRQVQFSLARNVFVQIVWMALFYAHYTFWMKPLFHFLLRLIGF